MQSYDKALVRTVLGQFTLKCQDPDSNCVAGGQDLEVPFADVTSSLLYVQFNSVHEVT